LRKKQKKEREHGMGGLSKDPVGKGEGILLKYLSAELH